MSRIRTIKPEFFQHDRLAECSPLARLLFIGLWTQADREGRLEDRPRRLKAAVLPYDECDFDALLAELERGGFIQRGTFGEVPIISIPKFLKHQRPNTRELPSVLGPSTVQIMPEHNLDDARAESRSSRLREREGEREEKSMGGAAASPPRSEVDRFAQEFAEHIRPIYPRREGDQRWPTAISAFRAHRKRGVPLEELVAGLRRYVALCEHRGQVGTAMVKQAASFFGRDECWKESYELGAAPPGQDPAEEARQRVIAESERQRAVAAQRAEMALPRQEQASRVAELRLSLARRAEG